MSCLALGDMTNSMNFSASSCSALGALASMPRALGNAVTGVEELDLDLAVGLEAGADAGGALDQRQLYDAGFQGGQSVAVGEVD